MSAKAEQYDVIRRPVITEKATMASISFLYSDMLLDIFQPFLVLAMASSTPLARDLNTSS